MNTKDCSNSCGWLVPFALLLSCMESCVLLSQALEVSLIDTEVVFEFRVKINRHLVEGTRSLFYTSITEIGPTFDLA